MADLHEYDIFYISYPKINKAEKLSVEIFLIFKLLKSSLPAEKKFFLRNKLRSLVFLLVKVGEIHFLKK